VSLSRLERAMVRAGEGDARPGAIIDIMFSEETVVDAAMLGDGAGVNPPELLSQVEEVIRRLDAIGPDKTARDLMTWADKRLPSPRSRATSRPRPCARCETF
jgi:hypothetical protein